MVYWDDPEGCDGEEGGRGVKDGKHMYAWARFMSMYKSLKHRSLKMECAALG